MPPTDPTPQPAPPVARATVINVGPSPGDEEAARAVGDLRCKIPDKESEPLRRYRLARSTASDLDAEVQRLERARQPVPAETRKALVVARDDLRAAQLTIEGSQQIDPWEYAYRQGWAIAPYVDPLLATRAVLESDALTSCIEAMARGVGGHGYELAPRHGEAVVTLADEKTKAEIEQEKLAIERWFANCNSDMPFVDLSARTTAMEETTGYAGWEFLPDEAGRLVGIEPLPSYSLRLTPHVDTVLTPVPVQLEDGSWGTNLQWKRFRKLFQIINGRFRWFKSFGDPRFIDGATGAVIGRPDEAQRILAAPTIDEQAAARSRLDDPSLSDIERQRALRALEAEAVTEVDKQSAAKVLAEIKRIRAEGNEAHEVMLFTHFGCFGGITPYGGPRWYGATYSAIGRQRCAIVNMGYFDNNAVPRLVVLVSGAMLAPEEVTRVENYFKRIKGAANQNDVLVIQAAPGAGEDPFGENRGQIKLDIKPLTEALLKDGLFLEYSKAALDDVRRTFGLPPAVLGDSSDYSRAAVDTARLIAEEQVFAPERLKRDHQINHQLFPRLGFKHWLFKTRGAHISDEEATVNLLNGMHTGCAITTEEYRHIGSSKLGHPLPAYGHEWAKRPSAVNAAMATYGMDPAGGQSSRPGAPDAAVVPDESPDADLPEVDEGSDEASSAAEVGAAEADAAAESGDKAVDQATPKSAPVRGWLANVDAGAVRTAEDIIAIYEAYEGELRRRREAGEE